MNRSVSRIKYVPAIDGLRTLAILPVVFFHLGLSWMPGGFAGVDVFFVISGYLISLIILEECHAGTFSFLNFWKRRIRRILPALTAMIIFTSVAGYCLRYGREVQDLGLQGISAVFSMANITLWIMAGDYWGSSAESALLLHTWSLSVEEQFYLFFPAFIFIVIKFIPKYVFMAVSVLAVASLALYLYGADRHAAETFYLLPTRIWELAAGSLLAVRSMNQACNSKKTYGYLAVIGVLLVVGSYGFLSNHLVRNGFLFFPVVGALLILMDQGNKESLLNKMLSSPPMVYVGKLSYSLYLWHWPIIVFSRDLFPDENQAVVNIVVIVLTVVFSIFSYYLIEKLTRHRKDNLPYIALAVLVSLLFSGYLYSVGKYYDVSMYNKVVWKGPVYDVAPVEADVSGRWQKEGLLIEAPEKFDEGLYANNGVIKQYGSGDPDVLVIGSSIALMFSGVVDDIAKELGVNVAFFGARGTPVFPESNPSMVKEERFFTLSEKAIFDANRIEKIEQWMPSVVIIAGNWTSINSENDKHNAAAFIDRLGKAGIKVILVEQPPLLDIKSQTLVQYLVHNNIFPEGESAKYLKELNSQSYVAGNLFIKELASGCPYCYYMPTRDIYMKGSDEVLIVEGKDVVYRDEGHLSNYGALKLKPRLKNMLESLVGAQ